MQPLAYFLLKMTCCSAILFGYYWFFLRNKRFHAYNRFYLLAAVGLSITLPLLKFNFFQQNDTANAGLIKMLQVVNGDQYLEEVIIYSKTGALNKEQIIYGFYLLISLVLAFIFVRANIKINLLRKQNPSHWYRQILFINTNDKRAPFSFFKNIFWNNDIALESTTGQRILKHELVHVQEKHTHDKIFINLVLIIFWCNPIFWLLRKELHLIHEFIADKKAIEDGDTAAFAAMILASSYPKMNFHSINPFFYSPIKRRIQMLTRKNNPFASYLSRLLVLPVLFLVVIAFSFKSKSNEQPAFVAKKIKVVINAGHGGDDPGVSLNGYKEKDINLLLAKKIKALNADPNVEIILTRMDDVRQGVKEIGEFTNNQNADLFIALHVDSGPLKDNFETHPLSVFVARDSFENAYSSKLFASALIGVFKENYKLAVADFPTQRQVGIWVLQAAKCPAVLIEAGDMRNKKNTQYLVSEEGQTQFAKNVLKAISQFAAAINDRDNYEATSRQENTTTQFYKGKKIASVNYEYKNNELSKILLNLADYTVVAISEKEAKELGLRFNAPPPPPPPPPAPAKPGVPPPPPPAPPAPEKKEIVVIGKKTNAFTADSIYFEKGKSANSAVIVLKGNVKMKADPTKPQPIVFVDGKKIENFNIDQIIADNIKEVTLIKNESAIEKYGPEAVNGVLLITTKDGNFKNTSTVNNNILSNNKVFNKVEEEASFPGGNVAWRNFLVKNLNPNSPIDEGWNEGTYTIKIKFLVHTDGTVSDISTEDYPGSKTAQNTMDLIRKGPKWVPAKQNGKVVTAYKIQPVTYVVSEY